MARKLFLTDPEIREFERMDAGQIGAYFFTAGVQKASEIVRAVIASYRITARVANAGWALADEMQKDVTVMSAIRGSARVSAALRALTDSLRDYSPGNWPPPRNEREYAAHVLEELYETAVKMPSWESSLEKIYEAVTREYEAIT